MPVAVWARFATRDDVALHLVGQAVEVEDYTAADRVSAFKIKALTALGQPKGAASRVEVVGPCDKTAQVNAYTSVLDDVTLPIGPYVNAFLNGATDKDVFFLLRPDATAGALACGVAAPRRRGARSRSCRAWGGLRRDARVPPAC